MTQYVVLSVDAPRDLPARIVDTDADVTMSLGNTNKSFEMENEKIIRITCQVVLPGVWFPKAYSDLVEGNDHAASLLGASQTRGIHPQSQVGLGQHYRLQKNSGPWHCLTWVLTPARLIMAEDLLHPTVSTCR